MIIDMHTHTFPDKIAARTIAGMEAEIYRQRQYENPAVTGGTVDALRQSMTQNGVDLSIVLPVATKAGQQESINRFAVENNRKWKDTGIFSFGAIHPEDDHYKEILRFISENGMKGIKIHPDYQNTNFDDLRYMRIMEYASELGLIIVTHAGEDIGIPYPIHCTPDMVLHVMNEVAPDKLILAHMGGWNMWQEVRDKLTGLNLYFDTAFSMQPDPVPHLSREEITNLILEHGTDRVLFATDSPWSDQGETIEMIRSLSLSDEDKAAILGKNAMKLLELNQ